MAYQNLLIEELRKNQDAKEDLFDINSAIDTYMTLVPSKYQAANSLINITKSRGKDYLMDIKCRYSPASEKLGCYQNLYLWLCF